MLATVCKQNHMPLRLQGSHYSALTRLHMMSSTLKKVVMVNTCIPMYRNTTVSVGVGGGERGARRLRGGGKENKEGRRREEGEEGRKKEKREGKEEGKRRRGKEGGGGR